MNRAKIMTVLETPPEAIKVAPLVREFQAAVHRFEHLLVSTALPTERIDRVLAPFQVRTDVDLGAGLHGKEPADLAGRALAAFTRLITETGPDLVLVQGDGTTVLSATLAAFYQRIAVGQIEAGIRTFDRDRPFPGEVNRRVIASMADLHFAPTERARLNLLQDGLRPKSIFVTGNTTVDALRLMPLDGPLSDDRLPPIPSADRRLILVCTQRRRYHSPSLRRICAGLRTILENFSDVEFAYPEPAESNARAIVHGELGRCERVHLLSQPVLYPDLLRLMARSHLVLADSVSVQEEALSLRKPVLILRERTERQEIVECGCGRLVGASTDGIVAQAGWLLSDPQEYRRRSGVQNPLGDGYAARRIVGIVDELVARAVRLAQPSPAAFVQQVVPLESPSIPTARCAMRVRLAKPLLGGLPRSHRRFTFPSR
jgi:UDP-N-acetylglucosamine 2-epimerase (non-hydrolysing)